MRRLLLIVLLLGVVAVFALIIVWTFRHAPTRVVTLPSGLRVELLGTAIGNAAFTSEKPWQRLARKVLPRRMTSWIPPVGTASCTSGTNSVTVYLRITDPTGAIVKSMPWDYYATRDDAGFCYPGGIGTCTTSSGPGTTIHGVILRTFPRRQSSFLLDFSDRTNGVIASLRVPNPVRGPFPEWQPQNLPQTRTNGSVTLTLESLKDAGEEQWRSVRPKWTLTATEPAWVKAGVRHFTFVDATGNEGGWLSRREPAWLARARVHRERFEDFAPAERMGLTNLTIPQAGEFLAIDQSTEIFGVRVTAQVLAGPGRLVVSNGVSRTILPIITGGGRHSTDSSPNTIIETWQSNKPFLVVEVQNALPDDEVFIRLRDDRGREVKLDQDDGWEGGRAGGRTYQRIFSPPEDAKTITMEIMLSRPLAFEFWVNPANVQPAKP